MPNSYFYKWPLKKDFRLSKKIISKIKPSTIVNFDLSILRNLNSQELIKFRNKFLQLLSMLKQKNIIVDYDSIRIQSIKSNIFLIGPHELQLDISDACNYRCVFCLTHSRLADIKGMNNGNNLMKFRNIKNIIDCAYKIGTEIIYLSGHGEPLLHPRIFDIISYICHKGLKVTILTNASVKKKISEILKLSPDCHPSFLINLAAINPEKFSLIHNVDPGDFLTVLNNIKSLSKRYNMLLSFIIYKDNIADIFEFAKLAYSLGVTAVKYRFPNFYDEKYEKLRFSDEDHDKFLNNINQAKNFARRNNMKIDLKEVVQFYLYKLNKIKIRKCYRGWFFANVKVNGDVYNCCIENKPLGKVIDGNLKKVIFSPGYGYFVLIGKKGISIKLKNWRKCNFCPEYDRSSYIDSLIK